MNKSEGDDQRHLKIVVGGNEQLVNIKKIPYFESFARFQRDSGQKPDSLPVHDEIPFFDTINEGVEKGYRHFFRRMPDNLADYHTLCETLEFLAIDVLDKRNLGQIFSDLKLGKDDWDGAGSRGLKTSARDAAFRLLYQFMLGEFESDVRDSNMAFNATLFIVSHRSIFKFRARKMIRRAYEERFVVSEKQRKRLDQWPIDADQGHWKEDDVTTEEEYIDFDSDWSI